MPTNRLSRQTSVPALSVLNGTLCGMTSATHWQRWHQPYDDPHSLLSRRLRIVQGHIGDWLDERHEVELSVLSLCAGQCHDLLGVLAGRSDADHVRAVAVELDAGNVAAARAAAGGLPRLQIRQGDAGDRTCWADAAPADLVLLAGVLGNISDADVRRTVAALPALCRDGGTVIWTRTRRPPDLTRSIREWLAAAGFEEVAFDAPDDVGFSVGVHRLAHRPATSPMPGRLFTFLP